MITELNLIDHIIHDEKNNTIIMIIVDLDELWQANNVTGVLKFRKEAIRREKQLEHLVCLKMKVERYVEQIQCGNIKKMFDNSIIEDSLIYEIRVLTDFIPTAEYYGVIKNLNGYISSFRTDINVVAERLSLSAQQQR